MIYTMQGLENDHPIREMLFNLLPTEIPERADIAPESADALGVDQARPHSCTQERNF